MSQLIEKAKDISDGTFGNESKITGDIKEILKYALAHPDKGIVIELPWGAKINAGQYAESIVAVITNVTKERVYYDNPVYQTEEPKMLKRQIEEDGTESVSLMDLMALSKTRPVYGIIHTEES